MCFHIFHIETEFENLKKSFTFLGNFQFVRSFFLISSMEKPPKINFGDIALLSEPIGPWDNRD